MATRIDAATELTVADVIHAKFSTLPVTATVGEVREWFDKSTSRKMAFLADGETYAGSITRDAIADRDPATPAADVARRGPTVAPEEPASRGEELALQTDALRVPVVDGDGRLLGVVSVTADRTSFCGT
jgi:Mg/Co/Ni transporter MgtE